MLTGDGASSKPRPAVGVPPPPVSPAGSLAPHTARPGQRCRVGCSRVGTAVTGQSWGQQGKDATPGLGHLEPCVKGVTFPVLMFLFANPTCEGGGPEKEQRRSVHTETISKLQNLSGNITSAPRLRFHSCCHLTCLPSCPRIYYVFVIVPGPLRAQRQEAGACEYVHVRTRAQVYLCGSCSA